jgi:hypothetical protein
MPTPTKLHINAVAVAFLPTGGSSSPLTRITKLDVDKGIQTVSFKGDGDFYNSFHQVVSSVPKVTITTGDIAGVMGSVSGSIGDLSWTYPDARNGIIAGGGGLAFVLANATCEDGSASVSHAQIGTANITFTGSSNDGTTNPLSMTVL